MDSDLCNIVGEDVMGMEKVVLKSSIEKQKEKKLGAYFTPIRYSLELLKYIDVEVLKNPLIKILEPSNGTGNIIIPLIDILKQYHSIKHILENMIYTVEYVEEYNNLYKRIITDRYGIFKLNCINTDTLSLKFDIKFDLIVGNPPYGIYQGDHDYKKDKAV